MGHNLTSFEEESMPLSDQARLHQRPCLAGTQLQARAVAVDGHNGWL